MGSPEQNACGISNFTYEVLLNFLKDKKMSLFEISFEMP